MMPQAERYPFIVRDAASGELSRFPILPLTLGCEQQSWSATGLLDTGASVNVLPYNVGHRLGAVWDRQTVPIRLTGNLAAVEARGIVLSATVGRFPAVRLAFAWAKTEGIPRILGQVNFFQAFDVCFFRAQSAFEIRPSRPSS